MFLVNLFGLVYYLLVHKIRSLHKRALQVLHSGRLWPYLKILDYAGMKCQANTPAYLMSLSLIRNILFITLAIGVNVIRLHSSLLRDQIS